MTVVNLPVTTYSVRSAKPNQKYGSPAVLPIFNDKSQIFVRVPLDKIPAGATITSAILRMTSDRTPGGTRTIRAFPISDPWSASITWNKRPAVGALITTTTATNPTFWDINVSAWAQSRSRKGLRLDTTGSGHHLRGSSASRGKPVLIVNYNIRPLTPGALTPNGGSISVPSPILTYAGDDDMTMQKVEFSNDGVTVSSATNWLSAIEGRFDPSSAPGVQPVLADGGAGIYWRVRTQGPDGDSDPSVWAYYEYDALPNVVITSPGATTPDGTPVLQWTTPSQQSWKATIRGESGNEIESSGWRDQPANRDWTPSKGVKVPGGNGSFELLVRDAISPRVSATAAPTHQRVTHEFTTTLDPVAAAISSLTLTYADPVPILTGTRAAGVPDQVALFRDGVAVPIWGLEGEAYPSWAPGGDFFTGTTFSIPDYTAEPRHEYTWSVRTKTLPSSVSSVGPTVTGQFNTDSVWLLNPRTGNTVEIFGYNDEPAVEQQTEEASILHVPINGGLLVEPKRRRLIRTTKSGAISGAVQNEHEDRLLGWVEGDSGDKYRLIFGKVNWSVIIGDYSPTDLFYFDACGPNRVLVALNWWQRLSDV